MEGVRPFWSFVREMCAGGIGQNRFRISKLKISSWRNACLQCRKGTDVDLIVVLTTFYFVLFKKLEGVMYCRERL
jgi:hypothetical protein